MNVDLLMSQKEECDNYNLIIEIINKLVDMCDSTEAIALRDEFFELFTTKYSEPLFTVLGLQEDLGCPLEVAFKLVNQNELYYQFYNELQHWTSVKVDLRKKVVWYCKQSGGHYACSQPLSNYGKTFWLREDKSE